MSGNYKKQMTTATIINNTGWTLLNGSNRKFDSFRVYERSGEIGIRIAYINSPGTYYLTVPASTDYSETVTHSGGIYARTISEAEAIVEFESKTKTRW